MWLALIGNVSFEEGSSLGQIYVFVNVHGYLCNLVLSAIFDAMLLYCQKIKVFTVIKKKKNYYYEWNGEKMTKILLHPSL